MRGTAAGVRFPTKAADALNEIRAIVVQSNRHE
jgi:hypothetical protein